jgi:hypothetical protein
MNGPPPTDRDFSLHDHVNGHALPVYPLSVPDPHQIKPRPWLYGFWLMRGAVTLLAAPGGTGKTSLITTTILACVTGRNLLGEQPHRRLRVVFLGLEESEDEMHRRFAAAMLQYEIGADELGDRIHYLDGREYGWKAAEIDPRGQVAMTSDMVALIGDMMMLGTDVLIADPLALTHSAQENDNTAMAAVMSFFTAAAKACNIAVLLIHHTRKGAMAGEVDAIRGAGALVNHARIAIGLSPMSSDEREQMNIPKDEARALVRIDDLKFNYSARSADARWVKLESVRLGNGTDDYPHGDTVQVPVNWTPPNNDITTQVSNRILDALAAGTSDGERFTLLRRGDRQAFDVAKHILEDEGMDWSESQIMKLLRGWEKNNVISLADYDSPGQRKPRKGIFVNNANRPGTKHD